MGRWSPRFWPSRTGTHLRSRAEAHSWCPRSPVPPPTARVQGAAVPGEQGGVSSPAPLCRHLGCRRAFLCQNPTVGWAWDPPPQGPSRAGDGGWGSQGSWAWAGTAASPRLARADEGHRTDPEARASSPGTQTPPRLAHDRSRVLSPQNAGATSGCLIPPSPHRHLKG